MRRKQVQQYRERQLREANLILSKYHTERYINKMVNDKKAIIDFINVHDYYLHKLLKVNSYVPPHKSFKEWVIIKIAKLRIRYKIWKLKHRR